MGCIREPVRESGTRRTTGMPSIWQAQRSKIYLWLIDRDNGPSLKCAGVEN
jgi:hypothetical protein